MFVFHALRFWLKNDLQHLILHVTNRCNLRCAHCFVDFDGAPEMSLERYVELGREVGPILWLDISGGEPFLRKDLPEIVGAFDAEIVQIPTNGSMPEVIRDTTAKIRESTKAEVAVSISIDGMEQTHDRIRGKPGTWRSAWDTFDRLQSLKIPLKINTVLTQSNLAELPELMDYVRARNPDFHSIILHRGKARDPNFGLPPLETLRRVGPDIFRILGTYDYGRNPAMAFMLRNYHKYLWNLSLATLERETQVIPCLAGRAHMVILGDGAVASCEQLPPVGNVREQKWSEILRSESFRRQKESIGKKGCHCTHNCAMIDSIFFRLQSFFPLLHQRIRSRSTVEGQ